MRRLLLVVVGVVLIAYQAFVSLLVVRFELFESRQRLIQILLIWFLPVLGALVCHAVVRSQRTQSVGNESLLRHHEFKDYWLEPGGRSHRAGSESGAESDGDG